VKAKTIRKIIAAKVEQLAKSISDPAVADIVRKNTIVTGGCIPSMLLKEPVNDYDIYFRTHDAAMKVVQYYVDLFRSVYAQDKGAGVGSTDISITDENGRIKIHIKSAGVASETGSEKPYEYFEGQPDGQAEEYIESLTRNLTEADEVSGATIDDQKPTYRPVFLSSNAITLSDKVQLIVRFYGEPGDIHANYDFEHCISYWSSWDDKLVLNPRALESLLAKELRYVGSKYPLCSIIRTRKFIARGWTINAGQYLKMAMQLNELDLKNLDVLEDQLVGVDSAYFTHLIAQLRTQDPEKVNATYIATIIDRIFT